MQKDKIYKRSKEHVFSEIINLMDIFGVEELKIEQTDDTHHDMFWVRMKYYPQEEKD